MKPRRLSNGLPAVNECNHGFTIDASVSMGLSSVWGYSWSGQRESNPFPQLGRLVPDHSALPARKWSRMQDLNPRPSRPKRAALAWLS